MDDERISFSSDAERLFERGIAAYDKASYEKARKQFDKLTRLSPNQRSSAGLLMLGKTLFRLERYDEARQVARRLEREYEGSRYTADASLIMGDAFYREQRYFEAASRYARLLATASPLRVQVSAAERLAAIVKNRDLDGPGLDRLRSHLGPALFEDAILFGEARWYGRLGWDRQRRAAMLSYLERVPHGVFTALARKSLQTRVDPISPHTAPLDPRLPPPRPQTPPFTPGIGTPDDIAHTRIISLSPGDADVEDWLSTRPRVGVILPLSDRLEEAREVLDGIRMANDDMGKPFDLLVVDTGYDFGSVPINQSEPSRLIRTVEAAQQLVGHYGVVALIGPLFSTSCAAVAGVAEAAGVPLIAPLAQQSGLDSLGQCIFQLRTVPEVQGQVLAEYATLVLGLQTFAMLAPLTDYGWSFERAFTAAVRANGGEVVHGDWYTPRATDYQAQFDAIRQAGFDLISGPSREDSLAVLDSLSQAVLDTTLAGDYLFWEMFGEADTSAPPDSSEMFIDTIDGLVVVVEEFEAVKAIAPQIPFKRLDTQVLGNDLWYAQEEIDKMGPLDRANIEGSVFVSGRGLGDEVTQQFIDAFRKRFGRDPGYAAFGYDAARILGEAIDAGHRTRDALRGALSGLRGYAGASGRISFSDTRRVNDELVLLKIGARGKIRPLRAADLPVLAIPDDELPEADLDLDFPESGGVEE